MWGTQAERAHSKPRVNKAQLRRRVMRSWGCRAHRPATIWFQVEIAGIIALTSGD